MTSSGITALSFACYASSIPSSQGYRNSSLQASLANMEDSRNSKADHLGAALHDEKPEYRRNTLYDVDVGKSNSDAVFENPLALVSKEQVMYDVEEFCRKFDLVDQVENFKKGAMASRNPKDVATADWLTKDEREVFEREQTHKWSYPWMLYFLTGIVGRVSFLGDEN